MNRPIYKLLDWIDESNLDWNYFSENNNENAIELLEANQDKIDWYWLSSNPNAIKLLKLNIDKVNSIYLSENPNAIELLK